MQKGQYRPRIISVAHDEFKVREYTRSPVTALKFYSLRQLAAHLVGIFLFTYLRFKYRSILKNFRPLAIHLEEEIFPLMLESKRKWFALQVDTDGEKPALSGTNGQRNFKFPDTAVTAAALSKNGLSEIRLDTRLEQEQIIESFLLLFYLKPELDSGQNVEPVRPGWKKQLVASQMLNGDGFHKFCALMRFSRMRDFSKSSTPIVS